MSETKKISGQFAGRLKNLTPGKKIRIVLILDTLEAKTKGAHLRRQTSPERTTAVKAIRDSVSHALKEIDEVLTTTGGRRLASGTDALGSVIVETTAPGVNALAKLKQVKAVLEDQQISLAR